MKKKIIIFLGSLTSGGAERVAVELSRSLAHCERYEVLLITLYGEQRDFFVADPAVRRVAMGMDKPLTGLAKLLQNIRRILAFRSILKEEQPDLVISFITRYNIISLLAIRGLQIPLIISERNYPPRRENQRGWNLLRRIFYRFASLQVAQTETTASWLREKAAGKQVMVIPNPISYPIAEAKPIVDPAHYLKEEESVILAVGMLKRQKGFDLLIESAARPLRENPDWKLLIIGEDKDETGIRPVEKELVEKIESEGLQGRVILPGKVGNVGDWYLRADLFVLSSRFEGFPNVLLEAMASGCASVAFDCKTGPSEMIQHRKNGWLVPAEEKEAMEEALRELMQDEERRKELASAAIEVRDRYSIGNVVKKWEEAMQLAIKKE